MVAGTVLRGRLSLYIQRVKAGCAHDSEDPTRTEGYRHSPRCHRNSNRSGSRARCGGPHRDRQKITVSTLGEQGIVPVAVKGISSESEFRHLFVGNLDARWIAVRVETTLHRQPRLGGRGGNQVDYDLMADQRLAPPVLTDEREQTVFDLVPFAGAW